MILQITDEDYAVAGGIRWQSYMYGYTFGAAKNGYATAARAVSVWVEPSDLETRIAICGETYDDLIPLSQPGAAAGTANRATGYVAVFDGTGLLKWSHLFYTPEHVGQSAVTDLSIRRETIGETTYDVVTYCGIASCGLQVAGPLAPVAPFTNLASSGTYVPGLGNTQNGSNQWDGFVGRLRHPDSGTTTTDFHSIVGGSDQDGLFGLAEVNADNFLVVGSSRKSSTQLSPTAFPFTLPYDFVGTGSGSTSWNDTIAYAVGTFLRFDASNIATTGLELVESAWLGKVANVFNTEGWVWTVAHDVAAVPYIGCMYVVGTTSDSGFVGRMTDAFGDGTTPSPMAVGSKTSMVTGDPCDGFALHRFDVNMSGNTRVGMFGSDVGDGLVGVSMWNEYFNTAGFVGWQENQTVTDIRCGSFIDGGRSPSVATPAGRAARDLAVGVPWSTPAMLGATNVQLVTSTIYVTDEPLATRSNGGVALDSRGRVNLVGQTLLPLYPYDLSGNGFPVGRAPSAQIVPIDAVRSVVDMLPLGVSQTQGIGTTALGGPAGQAVAPATGGTTPTGTSSVPCLAPYGWRIGESYPDVSRLMIGYEGAAPTGGGQGYISLVGYLPPGLHVAAMQYGFPGAWGAPYVPLGLTGSTVELWTVMYPVFLGPSSSGGIFYEEYALPVFAPGPMTFTVQGLVALSLPVSCDPAGVIASPGLVIDYQ